MTPQSVTSCANPITSPKEDATATFIFLQKTQLLEQMLTTGMQGALLLQN